MPFKKITRRNVFAVTTILASGVLSLAWILWYMGATQYQSAVDKWVAIGRSEGYEISYDKREQFGFPHQTVLRFTNVHWKNPNGVEFHAGDLDISADLWQTKKFKAKFKGQVEISVPADTPHYSLVLAGEGGSVDVRISDTGTWQECNIQMASAQLGRAPDYVFLVSNIKLSTRRPPDEPKNAKISGLTLSAEADDITLPAAMPPSFGPKMPKLQIDLRLMGPIPDFRKKEAVKGWDKLNGLVEFDRVNMEWGPLLINARGTMDFDDDLQPEGVFSSVIGHQEEVLKRLMEGGFIAATQQDILNSAMKLLAKPAPINGETGVEVPIAVQLGGFFLGPIKIFSFTPIGWDE